jgi:hypothetical protein
MAAETSGCANKEGFLKKKNSKGEWKDRFCYFSNNFFLTYKPKGDGPSSELKESIDLNNDMQRVLLQMDILQIYLKNGDKLEFKGGDMRDLLEWVEIMNARADWARGVPIRQREGSQPHLPCIILYSVMYISCLFYYCRFL